MAFADDSLVGRWSAYEADEKTTTTIELFREGETLSGRVLGITDAQGQSLQRVCSRCAGEQAGKPIVGMRFLWGLREDGERWTGGKVMDLRDGLTQGKSANAELSLVEGRAVLYAYVGLRVLGQNRVWTRIDE
jgi:uncharacterized protein (DUF2147 family)